MIEFHNRCDITIGDEDVLMGFNAIKGVSRFWFAPKPQGFPCMELIPAPSAKCQPPDNAAVIVYFVDKQALALFIKALQDCLEKM